MKHNCPDDGKKPLNLGDWKQIWQNHTQLRFENPGKVTHPHNFSNSRKLQSQESSLEARACAAVLVFLVCTPFQEATFLL